MERADLDAEAKGLKAEAEWKAAQKKEQERLAAEAEPANIQAEVK